MPPNPKPDHLRQRRNRSATKATLSTPEEAAENPIPPLPERDPEEGDWHPMVMAWWDGAWRSPMASEWLRSDMLGGLYEIVMLRQDFWLAESQGQRLAAASEIRLQEVRFGLSPIDRRRLQWTIEQGETAAERTAARREARKPPKAGKDPRAALKVV